MQNLSPSLSIVKSLKQTILPTYTIVFNLHCIYLLGRFKFFFYRKGMNLVLVNLWKKVSNANLKFS